MSESPLVGSSKSPRNGDGIQGEIAAPEVFHNGGPPDFRGGTRPGIHVVAGGGQAAISVTGKNHLHVPQPLVFENNLRAALFQFAHQAGRIAFYREIQVANGRSGNQVAHRAAGQIDVCARGRSKFLNAHHRRALLGGEPAFEHVHVIGHETPYSSGRRGQWQASPAALVLISRGPVRRADGAPYKSLSGVLRSRAYRSASWKYRRGRASIARSAGLRRAPAGAWRNCDAVGAASTVSAGPPVSRTPTKFSTLPLG